MKKETKTLIIERIKESLDLVVAENNRLKTENNRLQHWVDMCEKDLKTIREERDGILVALTFSIKNK